MFMTKKDKKKIPPPAPVKAVVKNKDTGEPMRFIEESGKFYMSNNYFTIFPSKHEASRAVNRMCVEHDPEFWRLHDVYEYEEE